MPSLSATIVEKSLGDWFAGVLLTLTVPVVAPAPPAPAGLAVPASVPPPQPASRVGPAITAAPARDMFRKKIRRSTAMSFVYGARGWQWRARRDRERTAARAAV